MRLLFVCTGNLCRSQIAAGLAERWLQGLPPAEARLVEVLSAGTGAPQGEPMDRRSATALTRLGGDAGGRRAQALTAGLAVDADLVLTMTREHRRKALALSPRGLRRTFTLLEAADLVREIDVHDLSALPASERAREVGLRMDARRAHRAVSTSDDIEDPIGRRSAVHDEVAETIARALQPLLSALLPVPAQGPGSPLSPGLSIGA